MTTIDIDFKWTRACLTTRSAHSVDTYVIDTAPVDGKTAQVIRQAAGVGRETFEPLTVPTRLYLAFAELDGSPEACVAFARAWGLLRTPAAKDAAESLDIWRREIRQMKSQINMVSMVRTENSRRVRMRMTSLDVALVSGEPNTKPALVLQPRTLVDAMYLQLAQSHASGAALHTCEQCKKWFEVGGVGKRSVAKFCTEECRNRFHYERRAEK
jgi:hypothetical protein